jgi:hypothetical protein
MGVSRMKVLFAVSNENISESIVKKYQKEYKEIISYKNVYYFNAIQKEIQRDKTYDRIVISEDLEPFANNDYEAIDRFLFEKLDSISDEATDNNGEDTPIILICSDRRAKSEQLLVKLFGIGVYSALLGQDRSIDEVCKLIRKPRTKKEAKIYYKIESDDVNYQSESEDSVSEVEIQNIRAHYRKLGKNEEAYVDSFNNIASQYTDAQLRIIVKFLPLNVRAVLERDSNKYQQIMAFSGQTVRNTVKKAPEKKEDALKIDFIENQLNKQKPTKPVIVPSAVNTSKVKKLSAKTLENKVEEATVTKVEEKEEKPTTSVNIFELDEEEEKEPVVEPVKKGRGRPKKVVEPAQVETTIEQAPKRGRGRPKKVIEPAQVEEEVKEEQPEEIDLYNLDDEEVVDTQNTQGATLPGFDEEEEDTYVDNETHNDEVEETVETDYISNSIPYDNYTNEITNTNTQSINIESLLTKDKKIVSFVGTSKNGTSFLINNLAELFSSMGINTAVLDMTSNKNAYFIYTKNEEELRNIAFHSMSNLENGTPAGIKVNNNLTVYTSLPGEDEEYNISAVLSTLVKNYSLVLIDTDFNTPLEVFSQSQEIYLVQSMDILTIQPLTAFLRNLKAKNVLAPEKLKIVVNKFARIRGLNAKVIIGGMAFYNDPSMSFMTELFNKDTIKYTTVPFDDRVYTKYLEGLVNCKISLSGYEKNFMSALKELGNMVYPLLNNKYRPLDNNYKQPNKEPKQAFSSQINNTLEQMKNNY